MILTINKNYKDDERAMTVGTIALLALCYFTPALISEATGYKEDYIALVHRANAAQAWITALFHLGVLLTGALTWSLAFVLAVMSGYFLWKLLSFIGRALFAGADWLLTMLLAITKALGRVLHIVVIALLYGLSWPFRASAEFVAHYYSQLTVQILTARAERAELKALYRECYSQDFPSFRAFRQYCEAKLNYEDPPYPGQAEREAREAEEEAARREREARERRAKADREAKAHQQREQQQREREQREREARARQQKRGQQKQARPQEQRDPYEAALSLLGLTEPFTKSELEALYRAAMKKAHPDQGGNAARAQHMNMARDLIKKRKDWS